MDELVEGKEFNEVRETKMFAGETMKTILKCPGCEKEKMLRDSIWVLKVKDIHFMKENEKLYFQTEKEIRSCPTCQQRMTFKLSYMATKLPRVLAIRVQDTAKSTKRVEILPEIVLNETKGEVKYEFIACVVNYQKGEHGFHSVEISQGKDGSHMMNDTNHLKISLEEVRHHPKILFYQRA